MEPRTTTAKQKLKVINELSKAGVRMGVMMGPMIPGLNGEYYFNGKVIFYTKISHGDKELQGFHI
jgi:DNA repair photolyase